ncbi:MAG: MaoC family dehydratase [Proteobacteria bacterium]|nr:MaoC family dehydratase [Pseudomonadota bacterium]
MNDIVADLKARAQPWRRGNSYEDFTKGQTFRHHWGRTITASDNVLFATLTLHYNPLYTNADYARSRGFSDLVVCPLLLFNTVFGLSVEDLSEIGGPFLGVDQLTYQRPVIVGETVYANSEVIDRRETESRPGYGIVTWRTQGVTADGDVLLVYRRANLVRKRKPVSG